MIFLRDARIQPVPKKVEELEKGGSLPVVTTINHATFVPALADIRHRIMHGLPLDEYYRKSADFDVLLQSDGFMHLHIAPTIDNDVLLLLGQTGDTVLFIALVRHSDLFEPPNFARGIKRWVGRTLAEWALRHK